MKNPGIILLLSAAVLNTRAANDTPPAETTNVVVITTDYINRLVAEARTRKIGRNLAFAEVEVRSAGDGKLIALGRLTKFLPI